MGKRGLAERGARRRRRREPRWKLGRVWEGGAHTRRPRQPRWLAARQRPRSVKQAGRFPRHCPDAPRAQFNRQKLKTGIDPGITGAWLHTHNLHRGTDREQICSQKTSERWESVDDAMTNAFGENWGEEHPELDAQIIYDAAGRMPHGRLGIANELFTKTEKSKVKYRRVLVSQPVRPVPSAREVRLERENDCLKRDNKRLRGIDLIVRSLAEKGGVDYDAIMQSVAPELATSDSEVGFERGRDADHQNETEKEMGSKTRGSPSREKGHDINGDDADDIFGNEDDEDGYRYGRGDDDGYGYGGDGYGYSGDGYGCSDDDYGLGRGDDYYDEDQ